MPCATPPVCRISDHQFRSSATFSPARWGRNGFSPQRDSMASRLVRYVLPLGKASHACNSLPYSSCTSCNTCACLLCHLWMAARYLFTFDSLNCTVLTWMFQSKPVYVVDGANGWSLRGSHMTPSFSDRMSMSRALYIKDLSCSDLSESFDKSLIGFEQFSFASSNFPVSRHCSPNHMRPPVCRMTVLAKVKFQFFLHSLYWAKKMHLILMNRWSSTHLSNGPMPLFQKTSAPASAMCPYTPADGIAPNTMQVSMQKCVLDTRTTPAGHWDGCNGIVQYASATSLVAASDPGGRFAIKLYTIKNFPHVVGKLWASMFELMDGFGWMTLGEWG